MAWGLVHQASPCAWCAYHTKLSGFENRRDSFQATTAVSFEYTQQGKVGGQRGQLPAFSYMSRSCLWVKAVIRA